MGKALQRFGYCLKEKRVERLFVTKRKAVKLLGNGKDDMEVVHGQQVPSPALDPTGPQQRLAFRAVPVSAGVVGNMFVVAMVASIDVAAQSRSPARHEGVGDFVVIGRKRTEGVVVSGKSFSENVGNFKSGLVHGRLRSSFKA